MEDFTQCLIVYRSLPIISWNISIKVFPGNLKLCSMKLSLFNDFKTGSALSFVHLL